MEPARSVSVIIPTFCKREFLEPTLISLGLQTYPAENIQVLVVDDCSDDGTFEYLQSLETPYTLVPIRHEVNKGRAAARNTAVRAATGDLAVFVDDDMRCEPDLIERHVRFHDAHHGTVVIGSAVTAPELGRATVFSYLDEMGVHRLPPGSVSPARYFVTNNASVERCHLLDVGLFDETFRRYGFEDTELAFRLEDCAGLRFMYCAEAVAYHLHVQTLDDVLAKRMDTARPLLRLLAKHPHRAHELSADVLLPPAPGDAAGLRLRKLLVALATNRLFYTVVKSVAGAIWLRGLSRDVMVYLIACQYRRGLRLVTGSDRS
ncbi:MAG: glycosyltransferase [Candidatus Eisenbacteria sp.]|nr:glycosyltransferase [Candidatus Eisenbacteria bacterium]